MAVVIGLLFLMQFMLQVRTRGLFFFIYFEKEVEVEMDVVRVDDNFLRLAQTIDLIPQRFPYVYFGRVLYTLARPIPRVFWRNKPTDPGFDLAKAIRAGQVNLTFSVPGDFYMSYGFLAVGWGGSTAGCLPCGAAFWAIVRRRAC